MGLVAYLELRIVRYADGIIHHYLKQLCLLWQVLPSFYRHRYDICIRPKVSRVHICFVRLLVSFGVYFEEGLPSNCQSYEYLATLPICISVQQSLAL